MANTRTAPPAFGSAPLPTPYHAALSSFAPTLLLSVSRPRRPLVVRRAVPIAQHATPSAASNASNGHDANPPDVSATSLSSSPSPSSSTSRSSSLASSSAASAAAGMHMSTRRRVRVRPATPASNMAQKLSIGGKLSMSDGSIPDTRGPSGRRSAGRRARGGQNSRTSSSASSATSRGVGRRQASESDESRPLASLHELTEHIAGLLHVGGLHDMNTKNLLCPKDAPTSDLARAGLRKKHQVVIVFGKRLVGDKFTVEYAKRVVTLVKQIAAGDIVPDTICFAGGREAGRSCGAGGAGCGMGAVSQASAGYLFFRSVCAEVGIDASGYDYIIEEESNNTREHIARVLQEVRARLGAGSIANCHFTLVSSDYHLIRIQEVHRICPRHSLLFALEVASASWTCIFAAYPFCVSSDPTTAFLGRTIVLANDLSIVLVNLSSAVNDRQFFARENLARLGETFAKMRDMFRVVDPMRAVRKPGGFSSDMRAYSETLELAIHRVREAHTLLSPLSDPCGSVSHATLEQAYLHLDDAVKDMRDSLDPDRPLRLSEQADLLEDLSSQITMRPYRPQDADLPGHETVCGAQRSEVADGQTGGEKLDRAHFDEEAQGSNGDSMLCVVPSSPIASTASAASSSRNGYASVQVSKSSLSSSSPPLVCTSAIAASAVRPLKKIGRDGPNVVVLQDEYDKGSEGILDNRRASKSSSSTQQDRRRARSSPGQSTGEGDSSEDEGVGVTSGAGIGATSATRSEGGVVPKTTRKRSASAGVGSASKLTGIPGGEGADLSSGTGTGRKKSATKRASSTRAKATRVSRKAENSESRGE